ncbi:MAG: ferritin-like domain-containing protein [Chitinivibrionales bacterium]
MADNRFKDFISFAIEKEIEAASLYEKYAEIVQSRGTRKMLLELAEMERNHERRLREVAKGNWEEFGTPQPLMDLKIADYMVSAPLGQDSTVEDAMAFAMKAEQKAYALYTKLAELETDSNTRKLFADLASEELGHKHNLESEYEQMIMGEN